MLLLPGDHRGQLNGYGDVCLGGETLAVVVVNVMVVVMMMVMVVGVVMVMLEMVVMAVMRCRHSSSLLKEDFCPFMYILEFIIYCHSNHHQQ